jgi:kinesin family protein 13
MLSVGIPSGYPSVSHRHSALLQRGSLLSEPAIQVRRKGKGKQIWSLEKLENRLLDMRDLYQEWKECEEDTPVSY